MIELKETLQIVGLFFTAVGLIVGWTLAYRGFKRARAAEEKLKLYDYRQGNPRLAARELWVEIATPSMMIGTPAYSPEHQKAIGTSFDHVAQEQHVAKPDLIRRGTPIQLILNNDGRSAHNVRVLSPEGITLSTERGMLVPGAKHTLCYPFDRSNLGGKMVILLAFINEAGRKERQVYFTRHGYAELRLMDLADDTSGLLEGRDV